MSANEKFALCLVAAIAAAFSITVAVVLPSLMTALAAAMVTGAAVSIILRVSATY
jgi:hypothetical protein